MDKRPQRSAKNKIDLMPKNALCKRWDIPRWIDDIGTNFPSQEEMLQQLLAITPATECHIDGYDPLRTDHCVMVVRDEHDRILMTHEAASEHGDDARQFLQRFKDHGLRVTAAFSDYSQSFTEAIKAI